ncbi:MAG: hypothetical protein R3E98_12205 [Gemmatimonadota bacterium]|nr:hypothetical protein [Gemmatimonadota bacterium]
MSETDLPARRYSDEEVARLLKRATELQRHESAAPSRDGLTLAELESIAREAGIDAALVRRAVHELDHDPPTGGAARIFLGERPTLLIERTFAGTLTPDELEGLVPEINAAANTTGQVSLVGRTLNFSSTAGGQHPRMTQIMVSSRDGETRLRIEERFGNTAGALFGGIVGGGGVGLGVGAGVAIGQAIGSALLTGMLPFTAVGIAYVTARTIFRRIVGGRRRALARLADRIEDVVAHARAREAARDTTGRLPPPR